MLLALFYQVDFIAIETIIVDGYVRLNEGELGSDGHLYQTLDKRYLLLVLLKSSLLIIANM
ncbi:hypothetical protein [Gilliamella sp. A7]|uniref:hypothetical protein n=1 Tax=Gilliamella sp. A7 TaxID=1970465 RepID=UPI000A34E45F|nr:hypothetical protein [Gilliamella sp. A7]OTQ58056.1 hypothetical protein B6D18_08145 [Gilliamella sp. A7]